MTVVTEERDAAPAIHEITPSPLRRALWDIIQGLRRHELWSRRSANEVRRRYRRTILGIYVNPVGA